MLVMKISSEFLPSKSVVAKANLSPTFQLVYTLVVKVLSPGLTVLLMKAQLGDLSEPWISKVHKWQAITFTPYYGNCLSNKSPYKVIVKLEV